MNDKLSIVKKPGKCVGCVHYLDSIEPLVAGLSCNGSFALCGYCGQLYQYDPKLVMHPVSEASFLTMQITNRGLFELILAAKERIVLAPGNPYNDQNCI